jgi:hypothetical protein
VAVSRFLHKEIYVGVLLEFSGSLDDPSTAYAKVRPMDIRAPFMVVPIRDLQPKGDTKGNMRRKKNADLDYEEEEEEEEKQEKEREKEKGGEQQEWTLPVRSVAEWKENMFLVKMGQWNPRNSFVFIHSIFYAQHNTHTRAHTRTHTHIHKHLFRHS